MAYGLGTTAALSGATIYQLRRWRRLAESDSLLAPETSAAPRILYSFRDLLALRTFVYLHRNASLQKIRGAIGNLRDLSEVEQTSSYSLVSDDCDDVRLIKDVAEGIDLVRRPGQRQFPVDMGNVIAPFPVRPGVVVPHLLRPRAHLSVDPETQGGIPVIAGTRVPYDTVASLMRGDVPAEKVSDYYPAVTAEAARDALDFAMNVDSYSRTA